MSYGKNFCGLAIQRSSQPGRSRWWAFVSGGPMMSFFVSTGPIEWHCRHSVAVHHQAIGVGDVGVVLHPGGLLLVHAARGDRVRQPRASSVQILSCLPSASAAACTLSDSALSPAARPRASFLVSVLLVFAGLARHRASSWPRSRLLGRLGALLPSLQLTLGVGLLRLVVLEDLLPDRRQLLDLLVEAGLVLGAPAAASP